MASNATWLSALSLLPPLAVFLSLLTLDWPDRRALSLLALAAGVASAFLGLAQLAEGPTSPLRLYQVTNESSPVGFFANQNHFAALLYSAIPLTAAWLAAKLGAMRFAGGRGRGNVDVVSLMKTIAMSIALLTLITVEVIGRSRAGIILTVVGLFGALALTGERPRHIKNLASPRAVLGVVALVFLLVGNSALVRVLDRFGADPLSDGRVVFARVTVSAAKTLMPIGAGLGAFIPVYAMFAKPPDLMVGEYVNHAHNDLLELWLETGVAGPLLLCLFLYWLVGRAARAWGPSNPGPLPIDKYLIRAAILIIVLLLCHSLVDYPLRTGALMAIIAFACALLIDPALPAVATEPVATPIDAGRRRKGRSAIERSQGRSPRDDQPRRRVRLP
jgi:O-antigen ligase